MKIKFIRNLHLYLGCFFAPLIIFFALSGGLQVLSLHLQSKLPENNPPGWVMSMSDAHMSGGKFQLQQCSKYNDCRYFIYLSVAMAFCLILNIILGIILAFKLTPQHRSRLIAILISGIALPYLLYMLHPQSPAQSSGAPSATPSTLTEQ